jgi:hypothetical protein
LHERRRGLEDVGRHELAEEDDVGLQHPAAHGARGDGHGLDVVDLHVAVGSEPDRGAEVDLGVQLGEPVGDRLARIVLAAAQAQHAIHAAVQFDDVTTAGTAVQSVDVLRDDA